MNVYCNRCGSRLVRPGAVVLSPPKGRLGALLGRWKVTKLHVCTKCWPTVEAAVEGRRKPRG